MLQIEFTAIAIGKFEANRKCPELPTRSKVVSCFVFANKYTSSASNAIFVKLTFYHSVFLVFYLSFFRHFGICHFLYSSVCGDARDFSIGEFCGRSSEAIIWDTGFESLFFLLLLISSILPMGNGLTCHFAALFNSVFIHVLVWTDRFRFKMCFKYLLSSKSISFEPFQKCRNWIGQYIKQKESLPRRPK